MADCQHPKEPEGGWGDMSSPAALMLVGKEPSYLFCGKCKARVDLPKEDAERIISMHKAGGETRDAAYEMSVDLVNSASVSDG